MPKDLRSFLKEYPETHPDQFVQISKPISADEEITQVVNLLEKQGRYPVVLCDRVRTIDGKESPHPVVTNLFADRERLAEMIGSNSIDAAKDYYKRIDVDPIDPVTVSASEAPVKEVVLTGDQIDLHALPLMRHWYMDPGPYISAGFLTCYDPDTGVENCALQRGWANTPNSVRIFIGQNTDNYLNLRKYEEKNEPMPVAFWVGHHPLAYLGAQTKLGYPESHYKAASGMMREPMRLVPSETLGENFLLPADAEFIIEGFIEPNVRYPEGPFGEYPGYFGPQIASPQMRVTAITHRKDAIWASVVTGKADHTLAGCFAIEAVLYNALKPRYACLQNVHVPLSGMNRFHAYLQVKNPRPGEAKELLMSALPIDFRVKHVFAFDDDVDIFDEREVMWSIATRTNWDQDVMIFPGLKTIQLDPSASGPYLTKGAIDCTKPAHAPFEERIRVSPEVEERVRLEDFLSE